MPAVIDVDEDIFDDLVGDALDGIPDELGRLIENVAVIVEDGRADSGLLGLYRGVPLTQRDAGYGLGLTLKAECQPTYAPPSARPGSLRPDSGRRNLPAAGQP